MPPNPDENGSNPIICRRRLLGIAGTALSTAIAGCGGSDDDSNDPNSEETDTGDDGSGSDTGDEGSDGEEPEEETDGGEQEEQEDIEPATFEVVSFDHPDEVKTGENHRYTITVENTGGETGTFEETLQASSGGTDEYENVGVIQIENIDGGETATWESNEVSFDSPGTIQLRLGDAETEYDITIEEPDPQSFAGTGEEVRRDVTIEGGLTVVRGSHDGESNFQVSLADDSEFDDYFINVIGSFDGAQADLIEAGEYILDVTADGSWEIEIQQPRSGNGESLPASFSGSGPDVVGPVQFGGTGVATGEHDGESNFQVQIYPMTGSFGESVFNEIGSFDGETTFSFSGIGWVDVNADGSWSVDFEG